MESSRGHEDVEDNIDVLLVNLGNQRENRQGRQNPNVQNDKTALRPVPTPAPALNIAIMLMMIAQAMQGKQAISQEQIRMQTERQPETGLTCILKGLRRRTCQ